ncbi:MAG: O-methyltransferase [Leptolyngbya sp. SIO3F4]|nr:O-methyltransferase [Leptolyngbya sp. SIO3F4]
MNQSTWTAVDTYFNDVLLTADPVLEQTIRASEAAGMPQHQVAPNQGKLLQVLIQMMGAKNILEIGTLAGYSTIWLGRAVAPEGRVITLEANAAYAEIAKQNIALADLSNIVDVRMGKAIDTLPQLENLAPFDFIFIDADKPSNPDYLRWSLKLSRPGTIIVGDNVVRNGAVVEPDSTDPKVQGVRTFLQMIADEPRLSATAIQTVGSKGYDGFSIVRVLA